ncbi:MAG: UDP-N-acetylmuramoyl-L-alanine--D-glutamate ligase [Cellulosilyticaceae bacterium]
MTINNQNILVIGCARSGLGAAKLAKAQGAKVWVYDQKQRLEMNEAMQVTIQELEELGIIFLLGEEINVEQVEIVIVSPGVPLEMPLVQRCMSAQKCVMGEFEFASRFCKAPILAITGTNGKTTTTSLVGEIARHYNSQTYVVGNIGRAFSEDVPQIEEDAIVVAEVSSFQLETAETFTPNVAALLNITPDHLNRHKTMVNYCKAKYNIFANQAPEQFAILNENDDYFEDAKQYVKSTLLTFNVDQEVERGAYCKQGMLYVNCFGIEEAVCRVDEMFILGRHNVENALAAIVLTRAHGIPVEVIREVLLAFKGVEHRIEYVCTQKGVDFYNDSKATNTGAAIPGLLAMRKPVRLIGGGLDKKISFEDWIACFNNRVVKLYLIGETKAQIIAECQAAGFTAIACFDTFEECVKTAYDEAQNGECVLLSPACASWDMFESYEQRGDLFKQIVCQLEG